VNASPIGDTPPALLALDAEVVVAGPNGERTVPLDGFFTAYRKTALAPGELVTAVRIPRPFPTINRFYKVSKRVLDDISTVAAGFGITLDADGATVTKARLAYGGVAATPARAHDAEDVLVGKPWSPETIGQAQAVLERTFSPITDQRGSERYRSAMVTRLLDKLWADTRPNGGGGAA
jgi:xanthine dehydrogenase small subunit